MNDLVVVKDFIVDGLGAEFPGVSFDVSVEKPWVGVPVFIVSHSGEVSGVMVRKFLYRLLNVSVLRDRRIRIAVNVNRKSG